MEIATIAHHLYMKILLLSFLILLNFVHVTAQEKLEDSTSNTIDTINISGKVVDEKGLPVRQARVLSETFNKNSRYIETKTDNKGHFVLKGIAPSGNVRVFTSGIVVEKPINASRYLLIVMAPIPAISIRSENTKFAIMGKRISLKEKYTYQVKGKIEYGSFHPFGHTWPASYIGGMQKFYDLLATSIVYPENAIKNNIEGTVVVEFTVGKNGIPKDFVKVNDLGYGCFEEVIRVIKYGKKWNVALVADQPVEQKILIEVPFKLTD